MAKKDTGATLVSNGSSPHFTGNLSNAGLAELRRAYAYALDAGVDSWDFALEYEQLVAAGLTISDLRWLVAKGYVEHGRETSNYGDAHRSFQKSGGLQFGPETCFVLTRAGDDYFDEPLDDESLTPTDGLGSPAGAATKPHWNAGRRELWIGDQLVKRFRVPARNQEWILEVFEEDDWPEYIDDPLPPSPNIDPKARLHDAINRLNHKQISARLRFHGNGNGKGVYWELVQP